MAQQSIKWKEIFPFYLAYLAEQIKGSFVFFNLKKFSICRDEIWKSGPLYNPSVIIMRYSNYTGSSTGTGKYI